MIDEILQWTNKFKISISHNYAQDGDCLKSNKTEIIELFGVLYVIGIRDSGHAKVRGIYASYGTGIPIVRAVLSY